MRTNLDSLQADVLSLPPSDRARLLEILIASLDVDAEAEAAWELVADARERQLLAGSATSVAFEVAVARLEARFPG